MVFYPADKPQQKTIMEYNSIQFNVKIPDYYFTTQFMTKVK
jgi:outer membrane lipoprotein-sorting protein